MKLRTIRESSPFHDLEYKGIEDDLFGGFDLDLDEIQEPSAAELRATDE